MIAEVIDRLRSDQAALGLKLIGGAADFQTAAETRPAATPAAFVYLLEEMPSDGKVAGASIQSVAQLLGVCLVVRNVADAAGAAASADMEALRREVKQRLFGFAPAERSPLLRGPSRLLAFAEGYMWWQDTYTTSYIDKSPL